MSDDAPQWLTVMRAITGTTEAPGDADNPKILGMASYIGTKWPEMADYCASYKHDETPWCGLTVAFCVSVADIRPPYKPPPADETEDFLWALSWASDPGFVSIGRPVMGAIVVMERSGGGHVTLYERTDADGDYECRGGNQSDCVNVSAYDPDTVVAIVWPRGVPVPQIPVEDRPTLERGDSGPDVTDMQRMIPNFSDVVDGDFGPATEQNVIRYQTTRGLEVDGICGQETWGALYADAPPLPPPAPPPGALTFEQQQQIKQIALNSHIAGYPWKDRGLAPDGFTQGCALAFAQSYKKLKANYAPVVEMAKARSSSSKDVFNEYLPEFHATGMNNETAGVDCLRHLYAFLLGHGMRESSGAYCCGRDQSADNTSSDEAEAGAWQTSYNAHSASDPEFDQLMDSYLAGNSPGYVDAFADEVTCSSADWANYGSGRGEQFQDTCKKMPAFAAESAALTLRNLCNHYGPVTRHEVELKRKADDMFQQVQDYLDGVSV